MSGINPVTKDQLFEKKIAENTGSNYNVGDISDIVPVTKDQALLKEIALNSAGQSGDITELEGKVADNTGAIEAIVDVTGACNIMPNNASTTTDEHGTTFTVSADRSVTVERVTPDAAYSNLLLSSNVLIKAGTYRLTSLVNSNDVYLIVNDMSDQNIVSTKGHLSVDYTFNSDTYVKFYLTVESNTAISPAVTVYPMLYDVRLNPTGYVPYAMTNKELTEKQPKKYAESKTSDSTWGIITTNVPETKHISSPSFGNYLAVPYCSGGMWRVQILDVDPNDGLAKKVTNAGPYPLEFIYWD